MQAVANPMKKSLTKLIDVPRRSFATVVSVPVPLAAAVLSDVQSACFGCVCMPAKEVLATMMEAEGVGLCGLKAGADARRRALRGGHTRSWLTIDGRRVPMRRSRSALAEQ